LNKEEDMTEYLTADILNSWHRLLQEIELAKNYHLPYVLTGGTGVARNPILDYLLPSLLFVKAVSILDEALVFYTNNQNLTMPKKYGDSLKGRIAFLDDTGIIKNTPDLHDIREKRNKVAHEIAEHLTWEEFDENLNTIESELQHLGFVGDRPKYEAYAECSPRDSGEPGIAFTQDFHYGLKREGREVIEISWAAKIHK
jgi:hypothetical protein